VTLANNGGMDWEEMRQLSQTPEGEKSDFQEAILAKTGYVSRSMFSLVGLDASTIPYATPGHFDFGKVF
jgi:hypothetical protein